MFAHVMAGKASLPARIAGRQGSLSHRQNAYVTGSNTVQTFLKAAWHYDAV